MNTTQIQRFDKMSKVLCSSANKVTLTSSRSQNGYRKLFEFDNGLKASVICLDGMQHNMEGNPLEVALITKDGILGDSIEVFMKVSKVNAHLKAIASTPSEWWADQVM